MTDSSAAAEEGARKAAIALGETIPTQFDVSLPVIVFAIVAVGMAVFGALIGPRTTSSISQFIDDPSKCIEGRKAAHQFVPRRAGAKITCAPVLLRSFIY